MKHQKCNCCECLWNGVVLHSRKISLSTARGKKLKYVVDGEWISWEPLEQSQKKMYRVSKIGICDCLEARGNGLITSQYHGVAQSYKWALLNDKKIWI